jgi:uncharacterized protein YcbX
MPRVAALHIYPIKACAAIDLKACRFDLRGPSYDRRFMLVDEAGKFLTQREHPRLALVRPTLAPTALRVEAKGMPRLDVAMKTRDAKRVRVELWGFQGAAEDAGGAAADWFSDFLSTPCRLVRFAEDVDRPVDRAHARFDSQVAFADGFPVLLTSRASLDDLNQRAEQRLAMSRFRPNVVVEDCEPYAEDTWTQIRIGDLLLDVVKPCERCAVTTVDQTTAERGKEPLATLAAYRATNGNVRFGQNCVHHGPGAIRVGDEIEVVT